MMTQGQRIIVTIVTIILANLLMQLAAKHFLALDSFVLAAAATAPFSLILGLFMGLWIGRGEPR